MFIHYSGTNVHAIGLMDQSKLSMNQSPQEVRGIMPGWNEIPRNIWDQNKAHPSIAKMLKEGVLKVLPDKVKVKVNRKVGKPVEKLVEVGLHDKPIKLKLFDERRAIELVLQTFNRDILQRWDDQETRPKVRKAITKQLKPLLNEESAERESGNDETDVYED